MKMGYSMRTARRPRRSRARAGKKAQLATAALADGIGLALLDATVLTAPRSVDGAYLQRTLNRAYEALTRKPAANEGAGLANINHAYGTFINALALTTGRATLPAMFTGPTAPTAAEYLQQGPSQPGLNLQNGDDVAVATAVLNAPATPGAGGATDVLGQLLDVTGQRGLIINRGPAGGQPATVTVDGEGGVVLASPVGTRVP